MWVSRKKFEAIEKRLSLVERAVDLKLYEAETDGFIYKGVCGILDERNSFSINEAVCILFKHLRLRLTPRKPREWAVDERPPT